MLKTEHIDIKGNTTLIVNLEDSHLINIIKFWCKQITEYTVLLKKNTFEGADFFEATHPEFKINKQKVNTEIKKLHEDLAAYCLEALVRGLSDQIIEPIQLAYDRKKRIHINKVSVFNAISPFYEGESKGEYTARKWIADNEKKETYPDSQYLKDLKERDDYYEKHGFMPKSEFDAINDYDDYDDDEID